MEKFPDNEFTKSWRAKNESAVALGKLGGIARSKSISKERASEIGRNAVAAKIAKQAKTQ
jgi:hypothetical protein